MKNFYKILFLFLFFINPLFANLDKVVLQLEWKHQFEFAGFYTAIEKGYYKDVGLNVQIKEYEEGINITNDVIDEKATFETFFGKAKINSNAKLITGVICGYRIEEIENPLTKQVRYLDKLVDELAKGRKMEKILRTT